MEEHLQSDNLLFTISVLSIFNWNLKLETFSTFFNPSNNNNILNKSNLSNFIKILLPLDGINYPRLRFVP